MNLEFDKYQGTGNDFVMLDNRDGKYDAITLDQIRFLCSRKLGIGADGLIKINRHERLDFSVDYYNADGSQSFCGNGARCSVAFAHSLGMIGEHTRFEAIDGEHNATVNIDGKIKLEMLPVGRLFIDNDDFIIDTGSPHFIRFIEATNPVDIVKFGKEIRYSERFVEDGINVNTVVELGPKNIHVATYERGVEDETLSCGTGVTACALAYMRRHDLQDEISVSTKGGKLSVKAVRNGEGFEQIWLIGPAKKVFHGKIEI